MEFVSEDHAVRFAPNVFPVAAQPDGVELVLGAIGLERAAFEAGADERLNPAAPNEFARASIEQRVAQHAVLGEAFEVGIQVAGVERPRIAGHAIGDPKAILDAYLNEMIDGLIFHECAPQA
jgi:hypothetical protein